MAHSPFSDCWLKIMSVRRMETPNYENSPVNGESRTRENCPSGDSAVYKWLGFSFGLLCIIQSSLNIYLWAQVDQNSNESKNISTCNFTCVSADDVRTLILERDQLLQEKLQFLQEKNQLNFSKDLLNQKNKELLQNNSQLNQEKNQLLQEKLQLSKDVTLLNQLREHLLQDKNNLLQWNSHLNRDKVQLFQEKDRLLKRNRGLYQRTKQLLQDKDELLRENCQLKRDLNQLDQDKTKLRNTLSRLKTTNGILIEKKMMCNDNVIRLQNQLMELQSKLYMAQQNTPMCLPGWRRFKSGCYQLSSTSNTWEFARQDCEGSGAHLVILTDKAEENFVSSFGGAEKFWIGLKAEDTSDTCVCTWTWVDGSSLCYRNWDNQEEPLPTWTYSCAHVAQNHAWLVGPCDESYYWICEKEL